MKLEDTSPMPFGKYKGVAMQDVSVSYLHWLYHNALNQDYGFTQALIDYIHTSWDALKLEDKNLIWEKKR